LAKLNNSRFIVVIAILLGLGAVGGCSFLESGPVAEVDVQPVVIYAGTKVSFDGSSSYSDTAIVSYHWFFDGKEAHGQKVDYTFEHTGKYTVALEVTDSAGKTSSTEKEILVYAQNGSIIFHDDFADGEAALERWQLDPQWASAGEGTIENLGGAHGYVLRIASGGDRWHRRYVDVTLPPLRVGQKLVFSCEAMMSKTKDDQMLAIYPARESLDELTSGLAYYMFTDAGGGGQVHEVDACGTDIRHPVSFYPKVYVWYTYRFVFSAEGYEFFVNDVLYSSGKSGSMLKEGGDFMVVIGDDSHEENCNAYFDSIELRVEE
jgi:PKD repeat protein